MWFRFGSLSACNGVLLFRCGVTTCYKLEMRAGEGREMDAPSGDKRRELSIDLIVRASVV